MISKRKQFILLAGCWQINILPDDLPKGVFHFS